MATGTRPLRRPADRGALAREGADRGAIVRAQRPVALTLALALLSADSALAQGDAKPGQESRSQRVSRLMKLGRTAMGRGAAGYDEARRHYEAVVALGNTYPRPLALTRLAGLSRMRGAPAAGLEQLSQARRYLAPMDRAIPYVLGIERALLLESARCCIAMGLPDLAAGHARALLAISLEDMTWRLRAILLDLDVCLARGDWSAAKSRVKKARRDAALLAAKPEAGVKLELRELLARRESTFEPDRLREVAARLVELGADERLDGWRQFRARTIAIDAWFEVGDHARVAAAMPSDKILAASTPARRAELLALRARLALARGLPFAEREQLEGAVARRLADWRAGPIRPGGSGPLHFETNRASLTTMTVVAAREGEAAGTRLAFETLESALALGSVSRRIGSGSATLAAARGIVPPDGGMLLFVYGPNLGSLLALDATGLTHHAIRLDRELWRRAKAYRAAIERPPGPAGKQPESVRALRARGDALAERLLPLSVRRRIANWRSVLLVGPEPTARLLHALPWRDSWFCVEKAIAHVPSVSLGVGLQARAAASAREDVAESGKRRLDLVLLGDPNVDAEAASRWFVESLAMSQERRRQFEAGFAPGSVRARWGDDAVFSELDDPRTAGARALCIFSHGVRDYMRERAAGFLLAAEPGRAVACFADQVERVRVPPLVLLGVCGASNGPLRMGDDGNHHLGGAFLVAGAEHVVLGHGELSVGATRDLLCGALSAWRAGAGPGEALRRARESVARGEGRAHPYFFAGLRLLGLPD
ncbi:MAG: CHAT domain-containing protein [bacterium]|nr:CHAT domain-containing protein [bacterium]